MTTTMTATTAAPVFDPIRFKQTTREQWQEAAEAWHRWAPALTQWLGLCACNAARQGGIP